MRNGDRVFTSSSGRISYGRVYDIEKDCKLVTVIFEDGSESIVPKAQVSVCPNPNDLNRYADAYHVLTHHQLAIKVLDDLLSFKLSGLSTVPHPSDLFFHEQAALALIVAEIHKENGYTATSWLQEYLRKHKYL